MFVVVYLQNSDSCVIGAGIATVYCNPGLQLQFRQFGKWGSACALVLSLARFQPAPDAAGWAVDPAHRSAIQGREFYGEWRGRWLASPKKKDPLFMGELWMWNPHHTPHTLPHAQEPGEQPRTSPPGLSESHPHVTPNGGIGRIKFKISCSTVFACCTFIQGALSPCFFGDY